jgi:acyl-CoA thioesterase superfamily protein
MHLSYFRTDGETLVPTDLACSPWSKSQIRGAAVSGALARAAERLVNGRGRADLHPARLTVDLFRPAAMVPSEVTARVVRESSRLCLVDVDLIQNGDRFARGSVLLLRPSHSGVGEFWSPVERPVPPPADVVRSSEQSGEPLLRSGADWSEDFAVHQNAMAKQSWITAVSVVASETPSPFQAAAATADIANLITNWGTRGVEYVNTDLVLALARLPAGAELGLAAVDRVEQDGIAVSTAAMYDRCGPLGTVMLSALVNARRTIDFETGGYRDQDRRAVASE